MLAPELGQAFLPTTHQHLSQACVMLPGPPATIITHDEYVTLHPKLLRAR